MSDLKENIPIDPPPAAMPKPTAPPHAAGDVENQAGAGGRTGFGVTGVLRQWRREDLLKRGSLALRGAALLFSLLSFIIMASNKHGDWKDFSKYEEYRYVLGIAILSTLYTGLQVFRQVQEISTGKEVLQQFQQRTLLLFDFFGDQIIAYLLISSASSAVPLTNKMRENNDNIFTDSSASSISMAFLAFLTVAVSAIISGYKLSTQSNV